jgi:hypothetical protein
MLFEVVRGIDGIQVHRADAVSRQHGITHTLPHLIPLVLQEHPRLLAIDLRQMTAVLIKIIARQDMLQQHQPPQVFQSLPRKEAGQPHQAIRGLAGRLKLQHLGTVVSGRTALLVEGIVDDHAPRIVGLQIVQR